MLVHNTIYKIIYKFLKIILLFYHFLCNLCLSHAAATLRNAYSFQVISILFLTKISLAKELRETFMQWIVKKKYNKCVFV